MKAFTISAAVALLAAFAQAAPAPATAAVQVKFEGGDPDAFYFVSFPLDGTTVKINNPLSVSHIEVPGGATCTFYGSEGSVTTVTGAATVDVGPPQPQVSGNCHAT